MTINWYGLSYIVSFLIAERYMVYIAAQRSLNADLVKKCSIIGLLSCFIGGRIGEFLLYRPSLLIRDPLSIFRIYEGGMSFFGGALFLGVTIYLISRQSNVNFLKLCDVILTGTPIMIFFVRIGNFINGELYGKPADMPWGISFSKSGDMLSRHPSQLYEAFSEGLLLFLILNFLWNRKISQKKDGLQSIFFCCLYGIFRFICEFFRTSEKIIVLGLTDNQIYAICFVIISYTMLTRANHASLKIFKRRI